MAERVQITPKVQSEAMARTDPDWYLDIGCTHRHGALNPTWPLCLEAAALSRGWHRKLIDRGILGGWPTIAADYTCPDCREQAHG